MWPTTDVELLIRLRDPAKSADLEAAWREFWDRYRDGIFAAANKILKDKSQAEKIVARVMLKLVEKMPSFKYDEQKLSYRGWLAKVVSNDVCDMRRGDQRVLGGRGEGGSDAELRLQGIPERIRESIVEALNVALVEQASALNTAFSRVKSTVNNNTWQAFWRTTMENQDGAEVAGQLGMNVASVYMAKSRTMKKLKQELTALGFMPQSDAGGEAP